MAFLFRWLMRAFLAMAALAAAGVGLAYYLAGQSLPDYDRTLTLDGPGRRDRDRARPPRGAAHPGDRATPTPSSGSASCTPRTGSGR